MALRGTLNPTTGTIVNSSQMEANTSNADHWRLIPGGTKAGTSAGQWRVASFFIAGVSEGQDGRGFGGIFSSPLSRSGISGWGAYDVTGSDQYGSLCYFRYASFGVGAYNSNLINNRPAVSNGQRWSLVSDDNNAPGFPNAIAGSVTPGATTISSVSGSSGTTSDGVNWSAPLISGNSGPIYVDTRDNRGGTPGGFTPGGGVAAIFVENDYEGSTHGYAFGGGGDGLDIKPSGSGSSGNPFIRGDSGNNGYVNNGSIFNGRGGNYGGGGGLYSEWYDTHNAIYPGYGAPGRVWFTYIRPTATGLNQIPSVVAKENTYTIQLESYWDGIFNGQFTVPASASYGLQPFYISDSRGARIAIFADLPEPPSIDQFTASPNPQTSGTDGIPKYNTTLNWSLSTPVTGVELTLTSSVGESWDVSGTSSFNITNLPQSVATSGSPSTRTYTLYVGDSSSSIFSNLTVQAYNDRTPSNSWTTSFTNLEDKVNLPKQLGTLSGIDMTIEVSCLDSGVFFSSSANGAYSNPQYFTNGQQVWIKMETLPFNTDVSGLTGNFGRTNTKTVNVTVGGLSPFNVSYVTRAPRIREDFNYDGQIGQYPEPDIDLISNSPSSNLVTQTLNMDDIEIDMEVKGNNPNLQIKINNGGWQNIRQI